MRALALIAIVTALLAGCANNLDPMVSGRYAVITGDWRIEKSIDRVTNAPVSSAQTGTRKVANSTLPFPPPAMMQLLCFKDEPVVRFAFEFKIGSTRNSVLGYVFDQNPGHEPDARFIDGYRTVVIEDRDEVARFIDQLSKSKTLYVRIRSLNAGRTSAEYNLEGAPAAIAAAYAGCPITPAKQQRASVSANQQANATAKRRDGGTEKQRVTRDPPPKTGAIGEDDDD